MRIVRRIVNAAVLPALLAREAAAVLHEVCPTAAVVIGVRPTSGEPRVIARSGCEAEEARLLVREAAGRRGRGDGAGTGAARPSMAMVRASPSSRPRWA